MYLEHFGMREWPFRLTPDTDFFYEHTGHHEALNVLLVALRAGEGFIKIVGEVGTGKTLLCRKVLNILGEDDKFVTAYIPNPYLSPAALRMAVADELGIELPLNLDQHRQLKLISEKLIEHTGQGRQVVLCLDEAQAMPAETLEALRLLTNLETEKNKLLQIVLFGQPELDTLLEQRSVRQLKQRIVFSHRLKPMDRNGMENYINYRLLVAGYSGHMLFRKAALDELYRASQGIPRLINILCHKALMVAYGRGLGSVDLACMRFAIRDTEDSGATFKRNLGRHLYRLLGLLTVALGASLYLLWSHSL
jgi:MSHA biogenesis protein MshM